MLESKIVLPMAIIEYYIFVIKFFLHDSLFPSVIFQVTGSMILQPY
jgi:hypothetical protein